MCALRRSDRAIQTDSHDPVDFPSNKHSMISYDQIMHGVVLGNRWNCIMVEDEDTLLGDQLDAACVCYTFLIKLNAERPH